MAPWRVFVRFLTLTFLVSSALAAEKWDPVPPADLQDPGTGEYNARILESRNEVHYRYWATFRLGYRRVKVYTPKGVEELQRLGIDYGEEEKVTTLAARVVHTDGTTEEFAEKDFQQSIISKYGGNKWKSKRLIAGSLRAGDVVEFRWKQVTEALYYGLTIPCQETLPVRDYSLKVAVQGSTRVEIAWYNIADAKFEKRGKQAFLIQARNLPAFLEEPDRPAEVDVRGVVVLSLAWDNENQTEGWKSVAGSPGRYARNYQMPDSAIRARAAELVAGAGSSTEKLQRLYSFCQEKITNVLYDDSPASVEDRNSDRDRRTAAQVLKQGLGNVTEINDLFAALAKAAGFDVRAVASAPRDWVSTPNVPSGWNFMFMRIVAVKDGDNWRFFSPGDRFVPFGQLRWQEEETEVLVGTKEGATWATTPATPPDRNEIARAAQLQLDAEGAAEGDVTITATGHPAAEWRRRLASLSDEDRRKDVQSSLLSRQATAEITAVTFDALRDSGRPLVIRFHLRIPDFCPPNGERLLLTPNVFEAGASPRYNNPTRFHPVVFPYGYRVRDRIDWRLPAGIELDALGSAAEIGRSGSWLQQSVSFDFDPTAGTLRARRDFALGTTGGVVIEPKNYAKLKQLFESVNAASTHTVVFHLKPAAPAP